MNMDFVEHGEILDEAFGAWKSFYITTHPIKERPSKATLGWMFWFMAIILCAQILLAALRTADVFYTAAFASSNSQGLAYSEAALAIVAIELGMVAYAMQDAIRNKKTDQITGATTVIIVMLGISITAGLLQSVSIIENISPIFLKYLQYAVSISIGVGASYVAWVGGKYLGVQIVLRELEQDNIDEYYQEYLDDYNAGMYRSWTSSKEYKAARSGLQVPTFGQFSVDRKSNENLRNAGSQEQRNKILAYVENVFAQDQEVPGPTEISQAVNCSLSYAHDIKEEWIEANQHLFGGNGHGE